MKKLVTTILVAVIMTLLATTSALGETYIVLTEQDPLLVRDAPYGGNPIGKLPQYTVFEGKKVDNYKVEIDINGQPGYVYLGYLMKYDEYLDVMNEDIEDDGGQDTDSTYVHIYDEGDVNALYMIDEKVSECIRVFLENDTTSKVIGKIEADDFVSVISLGPTYTKVYFQNRVGYVITKNLVYYMNLLPERGELAQIKLKAPNTVRLWSQKSEESTIMIRLFDGMYVRVISNNGEWAKVIYNAGGDTAYIRSKYLSTDF